MPTFSEFLKPYWFERIEEDDPNYEKLHWFLEELLSICNDDFGGFDRENEDHLYMILPSVVLNCVSVHWWKQGQGSKIHSLPWEILKDVEFSMCVDVAREWRYTTERDELLKTIEDAQAKLKVLTEQRIAELKG